MQQIVDVDVAKEEISEITRAYGLSYYFSAVVMDVIPSEITEDVAAANS